MIYLRTEDREVLGPLKAGRGEIQRASGGECGGCGGREGGRGGARGRGEEELCVMSVFPWLSYFEMCLNSPPSVRPVPGLRAARSPPNASERTGSAGGEPGRALPPLQPSL